MTDNDNIHAQLGTYLKDIGLSPGDCGGEIVFTGADPTSVINRHGDCNLLWSLCLADEPRVTPCARAGLGDVVSIPGFRWWLTVLCSASGGEHTDLSLAWERGSRERRRRSSRPECR